MLGKPTDEKLVEKAFTKQLPPLLAHLDSTIGDRGFMVADTFTVADIAIASPILNFRHTGSEIDEGAYPNLRRYADSLLRRPSIAGLIAEAIAQYGGKSPEAAAAAG